jgi:ketosteroid isomerase-like protein
MEAASAESDGRAVQLREDHMRDTDTLGALDAFRQYTKAFQALDARAVAQHFYEPAFLITPKDVLALPTTAAVEQTYARVMADMPSDYARTEFAPLTEHRLSDDLALVSGGGTWKNAANEDLMPFGMTYTLRRSNGTWKIVVAAIHAPDGGPGSGRP